MEKEKARLLVYDKYKRNIRSKFSKTSKGCFEEYVKRRVTISYFDFGKIQDVILRDAQKALLRYEVKQNAIVLAVGRFQISPEQFIYGIQPYLHVEYKLQCLMLKVQTSQVPCKITSITKKKASGVIFDCLPAVVTNFPESTKIGDTIKISILELLPTKKGPVAVKCRYVKK